MNKDILDQFLEHLEWLKEEILEYEDERMLWEVREGTSNSAGNLCYHILGNLNHFIGYGIGKTGYVRNRPLEFSIKDLPRESLVNWIEETKSMLSEVVPSAEPNAEYPEDLFGMKGTNNFFLIKCLTHLNYHLGQINYHRRIGG